MEARDGSEPTVRWGLQECLSFAGQLTNLAGVKPSIHTGWLRLVLAFLSGMLLAAAFPNFNLFWLAWLAPGLMLWTTRGVSRKAVLSAGYLAGFGNYSVLLGWLLLIPVRSDAAKAHLAVSAALATFIMVWCWVCWRLWPGRAQARKEKERSVGFNKQWRALTGWQRVTWPLLCAAAWVAMEMAVTFLFTGFPWNLLGVSQFRILPLIQIASITGIYGVSFLVAWSSVALLGLMFLIRAGEKFFLRMAWQLVPPALALAGVLIFGFIKLAEPEKRAATMKIALVQPAIPQLLIWDPNEKTNRFLKLLELSRKALGAEPDMLVWPEAALPDIFSRNGYTQAAIAGLVRGHHAWMVMGATDTRPKPGAENPKELEGFNSAFLINPNGELANRYEKHHLVLLGEYMPLARRFPVLAKLRKTGAGITPGVSTVSFKMKNPNAQFSPLICFEDTFPEEGRRSVDEKTDFILNLTNNGWFGEGSAQWQHAESALFRAVENGVPLVRCANNGLTCWIDAHGRFHDLYFEGSRNIYQEGYKIVEVPLCSTGSSRTTTFYNRHGDWFGWSCIGVVAIGFAKRRFKG